MPWKDLGEVVGKNGTIGNVDSTYVNNGGEPGVSVTKSGDDSAPDLTFEFENLVNDPLTSSEIEQISNDTQLTSSSVLNGTGLTTLWSRIKAKFATKSHTHDASDITAGELAATLIANGLITEEMLHDGAVTGDKIANGSITKDKLEKTFGDSLSQCPWRIGDVIQSFSNRNPKLDWPDTEWQQITGRFLRADNDTGTGGSDTVTLTIDQIPSHDHVWATRYGSTPNGSALATTWGLSENNTNMKTEKTGGGKAHNNMPAYQNVYTWKRTA